jgi:outer membrane protein TolC
MMKKVMVLSVRVLAAAAIAGIVLPLSSCARITTSSADDYIGPAPGPGPGQGSSVPAKAFEPNSQAKATETNMFRFEPNAPIAPPKGAIEVTVAEAIVLALENNQSLLVQRINPQIRRTVEQEALAEFDPDVTATFQNAQSKLATSRAALPERSRINSAQIGIEEFLPTGTLLNLTGRTAIDEIGPDSYTSRGAVGVTQNLLRGFGTQVNLATVNIARLDTKISQYELRGFAESLVAQSEEAYWDYALAVKQIQIFEQSLALAQEQLREAQERINVGKLAPSELAAAEAEVALRREDLINARSTMARTRLNLLRLLNPGGTYLWDRQIVLRSEPNIPVVDLGNVEAHVITAAQMRPEMNQAKLQIQKDEINLIVTRNGLLPQLDFFITLGKTGFADSFGKSWHRTTTDNNYDSVAGLTFELPPLNRGAQARNARAMLNRNQSKLAMANLAQTIEVDVRNAYIEIERSREQVAATAATRRLQEESLRAEREKFRVGKSTSLLVAQAQRDYVSSQINEISAIITYLKSFTEFYRFEGTLLERRGIVSPGREPVKLSDMR